MPPPSTKAPNKKKKSVTFATGPTAGKSRVSKRKIPPALMQAIQESQFNLLKLSGKLSGAASGRKDADMWEHVADKVDTMAKRLSNLPKVLEKGAAPPEAD